MTHLIQASPVLLIGHRATGKTTIGPLLAGCLGADWDFVDLDREIEENEAQSPAQIIAADEARFRRLEAEHLERILQTHPDPARCVIAVGAGCQALRAVRDSVGPLYIWLWRDGWERGAQQGRARLRAEMSFEAEVRWMRQTREPLWAEVADLFFRIPRARTPEFVAQMLADHVRWARQAHRAPAAGRSWEVPGTLQQLSRAVRDARRFGLAGVEVRSDFFAADDLLGTISSDNEAPTPLLASVRSADTRWLQTVCSAQNVRGIDIALAFLPAVLDDDCLAQIAPRTLLLSAHPEGVGEDTAEDLLHQARTLASSHPDWAPHIGLKYAPSPESYKELREAFVIATQLNESGLALTFLTQGPDFAWTRPILTQPANPTGIFNSHNYMPVGLRASRFFDINAHETMGAREKVPSPMDFQDWLPYFADFGAGDADAPFDGLIGEPVQQSMGDWWHTKAAIQSGEASRYLKIPLGRADDDVELQDAFELFESLGIRGLSVTSPLKQRVVRLAQTAEGLAEETPLNTLRRTETGWAGCDTDELGMLATLRALETPETPAEARTVAMIGRGGVSPAIRRAIEAAGWQLVLHASARRGWPEDRPDHVVLVVNAAGARADVRENAPACEVWLDLHYANLHEKPPRARTLQNGDTFFDVQARAQRDFWRKSDGPVP